MLLEKDQRSIWSMNHWCIFWDFNGKIEILVVKLYPNFDIGRVDLF